MLNIAVVGHDSEAHENSLARVTTECCGEHFNVVDRPLAGTEILWCCWDTPIGPDDAPDVGWVLHRIRVLMPKVDVDTLVLVSSQLPVGTTKRLEQEFPAHSFAYSPENIRVAHGKADFSTQARVVVGRRTTGHDGILRTLFAPFTKNLILTDTETAEVAKHALNCFLGTQIAFINEIARLCEKVGADANTVSHALLTERRVSPSAPLKPGKPFGGGHLARDIAVVTELAMWHNLRLPIIASIKESNSL